MLDVQDPDAAFYLWAGIPKAVCEGDDEHFSQELLREEAVTALPGSYLARADANGLNPGTGRIRLALVADVAECVEAAQRIAQFVRRKTTTAS